MSTSDLYGYTEHDPYAADDGLIIRPSAVVERVVGSYEYSDCTWPSVDAAAIDASDSYVAARTFWCELHGDWFMRSAFSEHVGSGWILVGLDCGGLVDKHAFVCLGSSTGVEAASFCGETLFGFERGMRVSEVSWTVVGALLAGADIDYKLSLYESGSTGLVAYSVKGRHCG